MLRVRDLMHTDPPALEPEETLRTAVDVLVSAGTGGAPVVSGGRLVGVVSLSDVLAFAADSPGVPTWRPELDGQAGSEPEYADDEESGRWFAEMWDEAGGDLVARWQRTGGPEWDALDEHSVSEVMTRKVVAVSSEDSVQEAARAMDRAGVHRLIVADGGQVVGVIGARDVVRAVARGHLVPLEVG